MNVKKAIRFGIFTGRSLKPMHPRLESLLNILDMEGFEYEINPPVTNTLLARINWFTLFFFDIWSVYKYRRKLKNYDIIFIQDMKLLPLAILAKRFKRKVIYETLDNNVYLREYQLETRFKIFKPCKNLLIRIFTRCEKRIATKRCERIIVNSKALKQYFDNKAELVYYCSSFESVSCKNNAELEPALLYLGGFSNDKGAQEILKLRKDLRIELYIFGTVNDNHIKELIACDSHILFSDKLNQAELKSRIETLLKDRFLIGLSLIKPVHFSYATQEANKEIDYLSLGIPFIGNHRLPTAEKIESGCGIFINDEKNLARLVSEKEFRANLAENCVNYYYQYYSTENFNASYKAVLNSLKSNSVC